jgi:hypothetical protein
MFNSIRSRIQNIIKKTSTTVNQSIPSIPKIPDLTSFKPKITTGDFKMLAKQQVENLKQIKLSTVAMPVTQTIKIVGQSTGQASWFLIKLFFRTRLGSAIKWTCGLSSLSFLGYTYGTVETHEAVVDKAYHKIVKGETRLIVIDKHGGVYHVENSIMWGQMNADGLFARIKPDNRYQFRTYGLEIPKIGFHKKIVHIVDEY